MTPVKHAAVEQVVALLKSYGVVNGDYDPANGSWEVETKSAWYETLAEDLIKTCTDGMTVGEAIERSRRR